MDRPTAEAIYHMVADAPGLDERKKRTIATWLSLPPACQMKRVAKEAGIDVKTLAQYRTDPRFMEVFHAADEALWVDVIREAEATMAAAVRGGEWRAAAAVKRLAEARRPVNVVHSGTLDVRPSAEFLDRLRSAERAESAGKTGRKPEGAGKT